MSTEEQVLEKVHARLAKMSVALHELLQEINPPAIEPLRPHADAEAVVWTDKELAAFATVSSLSETVDQALKEVIRLRTRT